MYMGHIGLLSAPDKYQTAKASIFKYPFFLDSLYKKGVQV